MFNCCKIKLFENDLTILYKLFIISIDIIRMLINFEGGNTVESFHYLLMKAHSVLNRRIAGKASQLGLSPGQPKILEYLSEYGESNQKTIASYCEIEQATAGSILLRMEESGLIKRCQRKGDRRALYVALTPAGEEAAAKMAFIFREEEDRYCASLSDEEKKTLNFLLEKICCEEKKKGDDI